MNPQRMAWIKENPAACYQPFSTLSLRRHDTEDIHYTCCCNLDNSNIKSDNQQVFFDALKNNIISGKATAECSTCYREESQGHFSERIRSLIALDDRLFEDFVSRHRAASVELAVKFSNLCPLACRSCQGSDSSTFAKIVRDPARYDSLATDLTEDPASWETITNLVKKFSVDFEYPALHIIGGETLIQQGSKKLLSWMHQETLSKYFELRTTTSLAVDIKKELFESMMDFKNICFILSIDSVGENYRYIRWPVAFAKIEKNLDLLLEKEKTYGKDFSLILSPVFSLNNIFYLDEFLDYFHQWMAEKNKFIEIRTTHLHHPDHLAIKTLPAVYREQLITYLTEQSKHPLLATGSHPVLENFVESMITSLKTENQDTDHSFKTFLKFTADFDKRTNTSFEILNNKLWKILSDVHKKIYFDQHSKANIDIFLLKSIG